MSVRYEPHLCQLFADLLEYPSRPPLGAAEACVSLLAESHAEAADAMQPFVCFIRETPPEALEEIYTRTFDLTPTTSLYAGHHMFGETYKRSVFLAKLQAAYGENSFSCGAELADHLCALLRFVAAADQADFVEPLVGEVMVPALEKIESGLRVSGSPYADAAGALRQWLQGLSSPPPTETKGERNG